MFSEANRNDYDTVIGVNGRVACFQCDWWCFVDFSTFINFKPINHPKLFISQNAINKLHNFVPERASELDNYELLVQDDIELPEFPAGMPKWNLFSGLPAPVLAWHLGAEEIHVFGADMDGVLDHDGLPSPSRHNKRWSRERDIWIQITQTLLKSGVRIWRILP